MTDVERLEYLKIAGAIAVFGFLSTDGVLATRLVLVQRPIGASLDDDRHLRDLGYLSAPGLPRPKSTSEFDFLCHLVEMSSAGTSPYIAAILTFLSPEALRLPFARQSGQS